MAASKPVPVGAGSNSSIGGHSHSHSSSGMASSSMGGSGSGNETYVSKEEVDKAVSLYFQASKERQEVCQSFMRLHHLRMNVRSYVRKCD
jgi:hypothetical protein